MDYILINIQQKNKNKPFIAENEENNTVWYNSILTVKQSYY